MSFKIVRNDIIKMNTEAIVNTANDQVAVGDGCDYAVYTAAGYDELLSYRREHIGCVREGDAFITPGFNLPAKYIIHAVSPFYDGGEGDEEEKLRSCYKKSLALAKEHGIRSIAFPLISTGSYGYPKEEGMRIAADEINAFLTENEMEIYLVVFDEKATELGERLYPGLQAYIDRHYVQKKREEEYGSMSFSAPAPEDMVFCAPASAPAPSRNKSKQRAKPLGDRRRESGSFVEKVFGRKPMASDERTDLAEEDSLSECSVRGAAEEVTPSECSVCGVAVEELDIGELQKKLDARIRHRQDSFSEYLLYLIAEKGMDNVEVYKRAIVDKKVFSKIKNNPDYHPQKMTALCLCIGAKLSMDEAKDLLARAGFALSPCDKTDIIFSYFLEEGIYDMIELDIQLEEHGLPCIIQ